MKRITSVIAIIFCSVVGIALFAFGAVQTATFNETAKGDYGKCENHIYANNGNYEIAKKATCSQKGVMYRTCVVCDYIDRADIPEDPENHSAQLASYWTYDPEPTCVSAGKKFKICYGCGEAALITEVPADPEAHKANGGYVVLKQATCSTAGEKAYECKYCNAYFGNKEIPADGLSHVLSDNSMWQVLSDPTCAQDGEMIGLCDLCKNEAERRAIPATGNHVLSNEWIVDLEPTCSQDGVKSRHCTICDTAFDETVIPADSQLHVFSDEFTVDTPATCVSEGEKSRHCAGCDTRVDITVIPADSEAHSYPDEWIITKEATCQKTGLMIKVCQLCGEESVPVMIEKVPHEYPEEYVVIKESADGLSAQVKYNCTNCGFEYITIITYEENKENGDIGNDIDPIKKIYKLLPIDNTVVKVDYDKLVVSNVKKNMLAEEFMAKFKNFNVFVIYDKDNYIVNEEDTIVTGLRINHKSAEGVVTDYYVSVTGDLDSDGDVTASDARLVLRAAAALDDISGAYEVAADVNLDGDVTATDARLTLRVAAGLDRFTETYEGRG